MEDICPETTILIRDLARLFQTLFVTRLFPPLREQQPSKTAGECPGHTDSSRLGSARQRTGPDLPTIAALTPALRPVYHFKSLSMSIWPTGASLVVLMPVVGCPTQNREGNSMLDCSDICQKRLPLSEKEEGCTHQRVVST